MKLQTPREDSTDANIYWAESRWQGLVGNYLNSRSINRCSWALSAELSFAWSEG
jgi:hypothetical protein